MVGLVGLGYHDKTKFFIFLKKKIIIQKDQKKHTNSDKIVLKTDVCESSRQEINHNTLLWLLKMRD